MARKPRFALRGAPQQAIQPGGRPRALVLRRTGPWTLPGSVTEVGQPHSVPHPWPCIHGRPRPPVGHTGQYLWPAFHDAGTQSAKKAGSEPSPR